MAEAVGATDVAFLIADFSGQSLIRLGHAGGRGRRQGRETAERQPLEGTSHGQALTTQSVLVEPVAEGGFSVLAPVTNRGEAIGVLELSLEDEPSETARADIAVAAHALAYVVIANRRFTDLFDWGQRSVPLSLAAEIQHCLLPGSYTCEAGQFTLAAWLEPAGNVGGDTFDFSLERDTLHLSMTDAMGHEINAAILATVLVGGLRNARRSGVGLEEQASRASAGLYHYADDGAFVTGQIARIDLHAGTATIVNAGHPAPLRLRDGRIDRVQLNADPPFGTVEDHVYRSQTLTLEPGDRIMFLTDGMMERNARNVDLEALLLEGASMHPREAVQHLNHAILVAAGGKLTDDATAMCVDWHGGPPRERSSAGGANDA